MEKRKISTVEIGSQASEKVGLWSKVNKEDLPGSPGGLRNYLSKKRMWA